MKIRHAEEKDIPKIMLIYESARQFMAAHGNPNQWGPNKWPPEQLIRLDIEKERSYVCLDEEGNVAGTFCLICGEDVEPTYRKIENGQWIDPSPYGVVHRIASDGSVKGLGRYCIEWAYRKCGHLRIDTHTDNVVMQNLLTGLGFVRCGIIHVTQDPYDRIAYEKSALTEKGAEQHCTGRGKKVRIIPKKN